MITLFSVKAVAIKGLIYWLFAIIASCVLN